jgi:hypothetical protein
MDDLTYWTEKLRQAEQAARRYERAMAEVKRLEIGQAPKRRANRGPR